MRIVIAEDAVLLRVGLIRVLDEAGETVVAEVGDAPDARSRRWGCIGRTLRSSTCACRPT